MNGRVIALALALLVASTAQADELPQEAVETIISIRVNDSKRVKLDNAIVQQMPDGDVLLTVEQWKSLGVPSPGKQSGLVSARSLGISFEVDPQTLIADFRIPAAILNTQTIGRQRPSIEAPGPTPKGALVNYNLAGQVDQDGRWRASLGHEVRANVLGGTLATTGQLNARETDIEYVRGLSTWQRDFTDSGTTVQVGDVFSPISPLSSTVNLAGVRIASDRGLQSSVPWPVPLIGGVAETRSTVEILADQQRHGQHTIENGPFQSGALNLGRGANDVRVILTDEFGRQHVQDLRFYTNPNTLQKGKTEFDVALGLVRQGSRTNDYTTPALSAKVDRGLTDHWTMGASVQATQDAKNVTLSNRFTLGTAGALGVEVSQSDSPQGKGKAFAASYEYRARTWGISASHARYSDDHWQLRDEVGDYAGWSLSKSSSVALSFTPRDKPWSLALAAVDLDYRSGRSSQRFDARGRYKTQHGDFGAMVGYDASTDDAFVGFTYHRALGNRRRVSASVEAAPDPRATVNLHGRNDIRDTPVDWRLSASANAEGDMGLSGFARARTAKGDIEAYANHTADHSILGGQMTGSVWVGEGGVIAKGPIRGSFALVEVEGMAGVPVSARGSRNTVKTNKRGYALVPEVVPLTEQSVSINPGDLPLDTTFDNTRAPFVAGRRSGAKVKFTPSSVALRELRIRLDGELIEAPALIKTDREEAPIGQGGVAYLNEPAPGLQLEVKHGGGKSCFATLPEVIPAFGTILELDCKVE